MNCYWFIKIFSKFFEIHEKKLKLMEILNKNSTKSWNWKLSKDPPTNFPHSPILTIFLWFFRIKYWPVKFSIRITKYLHSKIHFAIQTLTVFYTCVFHSITKYLQTSLNVNPNKETNIKKFLITLNSILNYLFYDSIV